MSRRLHDFPGGLHLPEHKAESTVLPIAATPVPRHLISPLQQHLGQPAAPLVEVGETVLKGQLIARAGGFVAAPVHASSSGIVVAIEPRPVPHASQLNGMCIVIETDGEERWAKLDPPPDWQAADPEELRRRVRDAGIVGLGGAGFPTHVKMRPHGATPVETLILNGAECEPYITCDDMFMRERADEVVAGMQVLRRALGSHEHIIAIEDNKPRAIEAVRAAIDRAGGDMELAVIPTRYPTGGAKQLIQVLTGKEVPAGHLSLDLGIACFNVATAAGVWRAVALGEPLISRVVTVTGGAVAQPRNFEVRIGTPMAELLQFAGGLRATPGPCLMGGPMMGLPLPSLDVPVIKTTNCLLAPSPRELGDEGAPLPCIRCGACAEVCPAGLLPQQLYWHARAREFDKAQEFKLMDCIECGCCNYVCPSRLPLVQFYRFAKGAISAQEQDHQRAQLARERFEARQERLARDKAEREARRKPPVAAAGDEAKQATIKAALERARAKQSGGKQEV
jgi:electron transport complex protein RnfC